MARQPTAWELGTQVAQLLNSHNNLQTRYTARKIVGSSASYYPEHFEGAVYGCVALQRLNFVLSEIKHLVVHPSFRGKGVASYMLDKVLKRATTPLSVATIREDNVPSLRVFEKKGFKSVARIPRNGHWVSLLLKANE